MDRTIFKHQGWDGAGDFGVLKGRTGAKDYLYLSNSQGAGNSAYEKVRLWNV
jgi:hypothetical protein